MGDRYTAYGTGSPPPEAPGPAYPAVCDPESCDCAAVGLQREGVHVIVIAGAHRLADAAPDPHRVRVADCDAGIVADHLVHQPGRCRCRFDDAADRGRQG